MSPIIDLHGITSLRLTPIQTYTRDDGSTFVSRDLIATGDHGQQFKIGLFADGAGSLMLCVQEPEPAGAATTKL